MSPPLDFAELGEGIGNATAVLRNNAASAGLDAVVPPRPGWTIRDLVVEQGREHRLAAAALRGAPAPTEQSVREELEAAPDLLEWLDDAMVELLNALAAAPEERQAWFHSGPAPADRQQAARRLCHGATVAAVNAMAARLNRLPRPDEVWFSPALARDGIDWLGAPEGAAAQDPRVAYLNLLCGNSGGS